MNLKDEIFREDIKILSEKYDWSVLHNSSILITGATGLIGQHLVSLMLYLNENKKTDISIYALVRNRQKAKNIFGNEAEIRYIVGDIRQPISISESLNYIIHGASVTQSRTFVENPVETIDTAYVGTKNILELARAKQVKSVVYLSSMEVFGTTDPQLSEVCESDYGYIDILNPRSSYSESKRLCECLCACYAKEFSLPVKIARLVQTLGAGADYDDNRVVAQFARSIIEKRDIVLKTEGLTCRPIVYTRDAVSGIFIVLLKGKNGEAYSIANKTTVCTIRETAEMIIKNIAENKIKLVFDTNIHAEYAPNLNLNLNLNLIESLGWQSEVGLEEAYRRMIESMKCRNNFKKSIE
ncbi:MAG: NAD(P)-dependent oxidoreductase [Paludibacter sp.]|nr:NAD(P)-dependent oxidoreductase [Paludibacter sp.]